MISPRIRLFFAYLILLYGIFLSFYTGFGRAWFAIVAGLILLLTHFLFGSVFAAFQQLRAGNFEKAEDLLDQIKKPEWLIRRSKAYYFLAKGLIAMNQKELDEGKTFLRKSLELGLRTENDKALALLNLAHIGYIRQNFKESRVYLGEAQKLKADPVLVKKMEELADAMVGKEN